MQNTPRKTIQSYLLDCLNDIPSGIGWPDPRKYIVEPNLERTNGSQSLPKNLRLLCGDFDLERTIQLISQLQQPLRRSGRAPTGPDYSSYLLSRSFLKRAIEILNKKNEYIILIDTDPYFNVITTHMGLVAANRWISAYSPSSQASQFAILRSIEFMFEPLSGLRRFISDEQQRYPFPWFDNRGNPLEAPSVSVASPYLLLSNMTNPFKLSGNKSYTDPQRLHRQTITQMGSDATNEATKFNIHSFVYHEHMWDMRRLGLICDYNGIELHSLQLGGKYSEPGSSKPYYLNKTGGTPGQLKGYTDRLAAIANLI